MHHFDPTSYEDDIYVERVEGRGRGKGFRSTAARSVFESDSLEVKRAVRKLYSRVLMILAILLNHNFTTKSESANSRQVDSESQKAIILWLVSNFRLCIYVEENTPILQSSQKIITQEQNRDCRNLNGRPSLLLDRYLCVSSLGAGIVI
jgi:hypothetical protein